MDRPIKFRVWYVDKFLDIEYFKITGNGNVENYMTENVGDKNCVLQQFIGVYDKNGKEIYEGDIVIFKYVDWQENVLKTCGHVTFYNGMFVFGKDEFAMNDRNFMEDTLEVVGNIFENPELLK